MYPSTVVAALTRSEKGAVVVSGDELHVIDAAPVDQLLDTTGAGDLFAAGMLYGMTQGYDLGDAGRLEDGAIVFLAVAGLGVAPPILENKSI